MEYYYWSVCFADTEDQKGHYIALCQPQEASGCSQAAAGWMAKHELVYISVQTLLHDLACLYVSLSSVRFIIALVMDLQ